MDIVINQEDVKYRYRCRENCEGCKIRYICFTQQWSEDPTYNGVKTITLDGHSALDLLMLRERLDREDMQMKSALRLV